MLCLTRKFARGDTPGEEIWIDGGLWTIAACFRDGAEAVLSLNGYQFGFPVGRRLDTPYGSITCLRIRNGDVRLGIEAPKQIAIDREEIHHLKHNTEWGINAEQLPERETGRTGSGESDSPISGNWCEAGAAI